MRIRVHRQMFGRALRGLPANQPINLVVDRSGAHLSWVQRTHGITIHRTRCLNRVAVDYANQSWPGSCRLPVERLAAICRLCIQADTIDIATSEDDPEQVRVAVLGSGKLPIDARFDLKTTSEPESASLDLDPETASRFTAKVADLRRAIDRCAPCIDDKDDMGLQYSEEARKQMKCSRFYLAGIQLEAENSLGRAIGTDGTHLAQVAFAMNPLQESGNACKAMIPHRAIPAVRSFLDALEPDDYVVLWFAQEHFALSNGDDFFAVTEPEGWRFPITRDIWPSEGWRADARLALNSFGKAVKATGKLIDKEDPTVVVRIDGDGEIAVLRQGQEAGRIGFTLATRRHPDALPIEFPIGHRILESLVKVAGPDREVLLQFYGKDRAIGVVIDDLDRFLMMPCTEDPKMAARRRQKQEQRRAKKAQTAPEAAQETTPSQPSSEPESPPEPAVAVAPETEAEPAADLPPEREPCINCGTTRGGLTTAKKYERTKGRCQSCYNHYRRTGKDKPIPSTKGAVA